jgi:UDP-N-acetylglucosamine acyltransferase
MIGGMTGVEGDVIPYGMVTGDRASLHSLNWIGLERRGFDMKQIKDLRRFYKALFEGTAPFAERLKAAREGYATSELAKPILDFLAVPSKRGLCLPE